MSGAVDRLDEFFTARAAGREPTARQRAAYDAAGRAERMLRRRYAREGHLGPVAQAEQHVTDTYQEGHHPWRTS